MPIPKSAVFLGLAGVLPFMAAAVTVLLPPLAAREWRATELGIVYGAVILSFLGGIRWGAVLGPVDAARRARDLTLSVVPSLVAFAAFLLAPPVALALLITAFLTMALWDIMGVEQGHLPRWFGRLRMLLTTGAVLSLLVLLVAAVI